MNHLAQASLSSTLPVGLGGRPKLKVLNPVVIALTVLVMNPLVRSKRSAEVLRHHFPVLKDPPAIDLLAHVTVLCGTPGWRAFGALRAPNRDLA